MEKIRILHTADIHLDSPMRGLDSERAAVMKEEQKQNFSGIIDIARSDNVELLLIAGDLFDAPAVNIQTAAFVKKCFEKIPDIPVFISPGNHDRLEDDRIYKKYDFGSNVHVFGGKMDYVELKDKKVRIYGYGFESRIVKKPCLDGFACPDDDFINILVMHGETVSDSDYNPVTGEMIEKSGFDYIALGHIHDFTGINTKGGVTYAFSGIPQGRHFDELGEGGILLGDVSRGMARMSFVKTSKREHSVLNIDVSGLETYEEITEKIKEAGISKNNLYKIVLSGETDKDIFFDKNILKTKLASEAFYIKIVNETKKSAGAIKSQGPLFKAFEEILKSKNLDEKTYAKALECAAKALEGKEVRV